MRKIPSTAIELQKLFASKRNGELATLVRDETEIQTPESSPRLTRQLIRIAAACVAFVGGGLLVVASFLTPSSDGLGTHHQLGLPPCSARVLFGVRCPSCGMTTSWAHFVRGQWLDSAKTNLGGFLLAILTLYVVWICIRVATRGTLPGTDSQRKVAIALVAIGMVTFVDWLVRLYLG